MSGGLLSPITDAIYGDGGSGAVLGTIGNEVNNINNLKTPDLQWQNYDPRAFNPNLASGNLVGDDPLVKSAQMSALNKMGDLANTGLSAVDQAGYQNAANMGNQMAHSGAEAAMQNAAARGVAGSGMEFANREIANQQGAQRAQEAGLQQAADSSRQRALYNQAYSNALGQQRSQDTGLNAQNAGILNQFNLANTGTQNQAGMYNVGNQNQAQQINQAGRTGIQQQGYQNQLSKLGLGMQGANAMAGAQAAQGAAQNSETNSLIGAGLGAAKLYSGWGE